MSRKFLFIWVIGVVLAGGLTLFFFGDFWTPSVVSHRAVDSSAQEDGAVPVNPGFLSISPPAPPGAGTSPSVPAPAGISTSGEPSSETVVVYLDDGFTPARPSINPGDRVTFLNQSSRNLWVASDPHPAHTELLGFDSLAALKRGQTYSFVFTTVGTWEFHNHANPGDGGAVIVEP